MRADCHFRKRFRDCRSRPSRVHQPRGRFEGAGWLPVLVYAMEGQPPQDRTSASDGSEYMSVPTSIDHAPEAIAEVISTGKKATVKKFVLHRTAIIVAAMAVGGAGIATDALARGGGSGGYLGGGLGGGHFDRMGTGHFGGAMSGDHLGWIGGSHFAGGLHHRSWFREANITTVGKIKLSTDARTSRASAIRF